MASTPRELARWRAHLEEVIGVEDAAAVVDPFASIDWPRLDGRIAGIDQRLGRLEFRVDGLESRMDRLEVRMDRLEVRMDRLEDGLVQVHRDMKELRRDLLRVTGAQFFALIAAVAAIVGLG